VRSFSCPTCSALIWFENSVCLACGHSLGFDRDGSGFLAYEPFPLDPTVISADGRRLRPCVNQTLACCNWLATVDAPDGLCDSCSLTRTRPDDTDTPGLAAFARAEAAKRRLVYQLDDLGLPIISRPADSNGLAFDLLSSSAHEVITGHHDGVITLDLAEGDDGHREALRVRLAEPYRTLLGHLRHEVGHWYWTVLVQDRPALPVFRALFGDERADYAEALQAHYANEPAPDWPDTHVSIYATAHPWEDWAETFAHYLHITDTLQTAAAFGVVVIGPTAEVTSDPDAPLESFPVEEVDTFDQLIATWLPLTYALNAVNRSMGKHDLYPFVLSATVLEKLRLVHTLIAAASSCRARDQDDSTGAAASGSRPARAVRDRGRISARPDQAATWPQRERAGYGCHAAP
jgi:hypothetical protein